MFRSIPDLHPQDTMSTLSPTVTTKSVSRYCKMSPGSKIAPIENHCSRPISSSLGHVGGFSLFKDLPKATMTMQTTYHLTGRNALLPDKSHIRPWHLQSLWGTFGASWSSLFSLTAEGLSGICQEGLLEVAPR